MSQFLSTTLPEILCTIYKKKLSSLISTHANDELCADKEE
jgi:hypothetical protein